MKDRKAVARLGSRSAVRLTDLALLVRAPAALSVPGDVIAGAAAAGRPLGVRTLGVIGSSVCLYWAGMALND
jgi:4-hydroxybenzoate polyprenyltransferase